MSDAAIRPAPRLVFVIPCYNEEETLPATMDAIAALLSSLISP